MPYIKNRYIHGLYAPTNWSNHLNTSNDLRSSLTTTSNLDWTKKLTVLNDIDWTNTLTTIDKMALTGYRYEPLPVLQEKPWMPVADYNDPTQLNSMRDVILGTFNNTFKHSTMLDEGIKTGIPLFDSMLSGAAKALGLKVSETPILRIVPDTLQYAKDYVWGPMFAHRDNPMFENAEWYTRPLISLSNIFVNVSETLDAYMNPWRVITSYPFMGEGKEDIFTLLKRSTVGDKTGIHNYDYDTGNKVADIILEVVMDPLNWISFGGKAGVKVVAKEGLEQAIRNADIPTVTRMFKEILVEKGLKAQADDITEEAIEQLLKGQKFLTKDGKVFAKTLWNNKDFINEVLRKNVSRELLSKGSDAYGIMLRKGINQMLPGLTDDVTGALLRGLKSTSDDIIETVYKAMSKDVLTSLSLRGIKIEDVVSKYLFQIAMVPPGATAFYKIALEKDSPVRSMLDLIAMNKAVKTIDRSILTPEVQGVLQVISREQDVNKIFNEVSKESIQEALYYVGPTLIRYSDEIKKILADATLTNRKKNNKILRMLNKFDSTTTYKSIEDFIGTLERLDDLSREQYKHTIAYTGLEEYIDAFRKYDQALKSQGIKEKITKDLIKHQDEISRSERLKRFVDLLDKDNLNISKTIQNVHYLDALYKFIHPEFFDEINKLLNDLQNNPKLIIQLSKEFTIRNLPQLEQHLIDLIDSIGKYGTNSYDIFRVIKENANSILGDLTAIETLNTRVNSYKPIPLVTDLQAYLDTAKMIRKTPIENIPGYMDAIESEEIFKLLRNGGEDLDQNLLQDIFDLRYQAPNFDMEVLKNRKVYKKAIQTIEDAEGLKRFVTGIDYTTEKIQKNTMNVLDYEGTTDFIKVLSRYKAPVEEIEEVLGRYDRSKINKFLNKRTTRMNSLDVIKEELLARGDIQDTSYVTKLFDEFKEALEEHQANLSNFEHIANRSEKVYKIIMDEDTIKALYPAFYKYCYQSQEKAMRYYNRLMSYLDNKSALVLEDIRGQGHDMKFTQGFATPTKVPYTAAYGSMEEVLEGISITTRGKTYNIRLPESIKLDREIEFIYDNVTGHYVQNSGRYSTSSIAKLQNIINNNVPVGVSPKEWKSITKKILKKEWEEIFGGKTLSPQITLDASGELTPAYKRLAKEANQRREEAIAFLQKKAKPLVDAKHSLDTLADDLKLLNVTRESINRLTQSTDEKFFIMHVEHAARDSMLNEAIETIINSTNGPRITIIGDQIPNYLANNIGEVFKTLPEEEIRTIAKFRQGTLGYENQKWLVQNALDVIENPYNKFPANTKNAMITTFAKYAPQPFDAIQQNPDIMIKEILDEMGLSTKVTQLDFQKVDLDTLIKKYNITDEMVYDAAKKSGIILEGGRHSGLYDTFAQHLAVEAALGHKYFGYTLDIETTAGVNKQGIAVGNIMEIALIKRVSEDKFEKVLNLKVQLNKDDVISIYNANPSTLKAIKKSQEEWIAEYSVQQGKEIITEQNILDIFIDTLRQLPEGSEVMSHNGAKFDWIYLRKRIRDFQSDKTLTSATFDRAVKAVTNNKEQQLRLKNLDEALSKIRVLDSREMLSGEKLGFEGKGLYELYRVIETYVFHKQARLLDYSTFTNIPVTFMTNFNKHMQASLIETMMSEIFKGKKLDIEGLTTYLLSRDADLADDIIIKMNQRFKKMKYKDLQTNISQETLEVVRKVLDTAARNAMAIKELNKGLREIPISSRIFDVNSSMYDPVIAREVQDSFAEIFRGTPKYTEIKNAHITNFPQLLGLVTEDEVFPMLAYKPIDTIITETFNWNTGQTPMTLNNLLRAQEFYNVIIRNYDRIRNTDAMKELLPDINGMVQDLNRLGVTLENHWIKITDDNPKMTLASVEAAYYRLLAKTSKDTDMSYLAGKALTEIQNKYPRLIKYIEQGVFDSTISLNKGHIEFIPSDLIREYKTIEYAKHKAINTAQENVFTHLKNSRAQVANISNEIIESQDNIISHWIKASNLKDATYIDGYATNKTRIYNEVSRRIEQALFEKDLYNKLNADPISLRNFIINETSNMNWTVYRPSDHHYKNRMSFIELLARKEEYEEVGLRFKYDELEGKLIIGLDDSVQVKLNKNIYNGKTKFSVNGEDIVSPVFEEISKEDFVRFARGPEKWVEALWNVRASSLKIDPQLSGQLGLTNYMDYYKVTDVNNTIPKIDWNKVNPFVKDEKYMPYFFNDVTGNMEKMMETFGVFNPDFYESSGLLLNKMLNHTKTYYEYSNFVLTAGKKLSDPDVARMSLSELRDALTKNKDCVLVYLKSNKHSTGGLELARVTSYSDSVLKKAREIGAVIVSYDFYTSAARNINDFTYGSKALAIWAKVIQFYKRTWLFDIGTILRNGMDSTLKNFAEGYGVTDTFGSYVEAFDLLNKYERVNREIRKMSKEGRFTLKNMNDYFSLFNDIMDKETFVMLSEFLDNAGINTINRLTDGIFGIAMRPNSWIERTARLAQFLNLRNVGTEYSEIMRRIGQTHFNYDVKNYGDFLMQQIIPFWTYVSSNIEYVVHLLEENPSFLRNFFNVYSGVWDFDELNFEEVGKNSSLLYQIINGNIPLSIFGYPDKEQERIVQTKYGPRKQTVTNTAVIKMGSSILDGLFTLVNPIDSIMDKLAPPVQMIGDTIKEYAYSAFGNITGDSYATMEDSEEYYNRNFGSASLANIFKDPISLLENLPISDRLLQRLTHTENGQRVFGSSTYARTKDPSVAALSLLGITGATSRWGEFEQTPRKTYSYPQRSYSGYSRNYSRRYTRRYYSKKNYFRPATPGIGQGVTYRMGTNGILYPYYTGYVPRTYTSGRTPYTAYSRFLANLYSANRPHRETSSARSSNMQSIPQYLYSYMGKNKRGRSKPLSWIRMNTRYKVKTTAQRYAKSRGALQRS